MTIKLPNTYCDAADILRDSLEGHSRITVARYGSGVQSWGTLKHWHIEEVDSDQQEGPANINLSLTYLENVVSASEQFIEAERTQSLRILCNHGDTGWSINMQNRVFNGDYPSTVAVNLESGEVFFINIRPSGFELCTFGMMDAQELETFKQECVLRDPFSIRVTEDALFKVIDGAEGTNYLKGNLYIKFNCCVPIIVKARNGSLMSEL